MNVLSRQSVLSAFVGLVVGAAGTAAYYRGELAAQSRRHLAVVQATQDEWALQTFLADILEEADTLTGLRRGKVELVISHKEISLGADLAAYRTAFPDRMFTDTNSIAVLRRAARYLTEHPLNTQDPETKAAIEELVGRVLNGVGSNH